MPGGNGPSPCFDGLGAARVELHAGQVRGKHLAQELQKPDSRQGGKAADGEALGLFLNGFHVLRMAVPQRVDADAADEIDVLAPFDVPELRAAAFGHCAAREHGEVLQARGEQLVFAGPELFGRVLVHFLRSRWGGKT